MNTDIHPLRIALGASAVLAAALATAACGSETAVDPPQSSVGDAPSSTPAPSPRCTASADEIQRRLDAGRPPCGKIADAPVNYKHVPPDHHPL
jgi:hypothetical protein